MASTTVRVVVADNDDRLRGALVEFLVADGRFEVVAEVATADQAVDASAAYLPALALVDVQMPGGGPDASRRIVEVSPRTYVVAVTARSDSATILLMLRAGSSGYLVKGAIGGDLGDLLLRCAAGEVVLATAEASTALRSLAAETSRSGLNPGSVVRW